GIFNFLRALPGILIKHPDTTFKTPTETLLSYESVGEIDVPEILTWADTDRDLTAWTGNDIQRDAINTIYAMETQVLQTEDRKIIETWRKLQTSDHFYYMCTKWSHDGDVHAYFSPYQSPYDAYIAFMNALSDLQLRVQRINETLVASSLKVDENVTEVDVKQEINERLQVEIEEEVKEASLVSWWQKLRNSFRSWLMKIPFFNNSQK
nr:hypothetical protein [Candidatus Paceibacterota bacterium]